MRIRDLFLVFRLNKVLQNLWLAELQRSRLTVPQNTDDNNGRFVGRLQTAL